MEFRAVRPPRDQAGHPRRLIALALALGAAACGKGTSPGPPGTALAMHFDRKAGWLAAPFPSDDLKKADGTIDLSAFPNPNQAAIVTNALAVAARDARGFSQNGGIFFAASAPLDPTRLPDLATTATPDSPVFLMSVDDTAPDFGKRYPIDVLFAADGGPFGSPNLVSIVPLQGIPLRPHTLYAAVVLKKLGDATGAPLGASAEMNQLAGGQRPAALSDAAYSSYSRAVVALTKAGVDAASIAGLAAFTTDAPMATFQAVLDDMSARPAPLPKGPFMRTDTFNDYCVYQSTIDMPEYQEGTPPYDSTGGDWTFDSTGKPIFQRMETARIVVTVPRKAMPAAGFPVAFLVRTGAGGDRPLVDRGTQATNGGPPIVPGSGPAEFFARAGFAGISYDGPLGGLRNTTNGNEDFLIFNVFNAGALRDNVRQSGAEIVLLSSILGTLSVDAGDCPGFTGASGGTARFDAAHAALMGHSMGATIAPLALAFAPTYHVAILSGAGASWMTNVLYKQLPLQVRPAIELFLHYPQMDRQITLGDPILTLFQWTLEPADPLVFTRSILEEPMNGWPVHDVLMEQGIVDHYILPPIANGMSLSLGLDLAGTELDGTVPELAPFAPLSAVLPYSGHSSIALPVSGNLTAADGSKVTAVVVQHPSDGVEDGHEIVFQTDPPKHEYECYLASSLVGTPQVLNDGDPDAGCR